MNTKSGSQPAAAATGMENITGNKLTHIGQALFARKLLVVSDVLCLFLGEYNIRLFYFFRLSKVRFSAEQLGVK